MSNDPSAAITALLVVGLLVLILRWVYGRPKRARTLIDASESPNLGLLSVVASGLDRQRSMEFRARLGEAQIRSSMSKRRDGSFDVLVFHADVDAARRLAAD